MSSLTSLPSIIALALVLDVNFLSPSTEATVRCYKQPADGMTGCNKWGNSQQSVKVSVNVNVQVRIYCNWRMYTYPCNGGNQPANPPSGTMYPYPAGDKYNVVSSPGAPAYAKMPMTPNGMCAYMRIYECRRGAPGAPVQPCANHLTANPYVQAG